MPGIRDRVKDLVSDKGEKQSTSDANVGSGEIRKSGDADYEDMVELAYTAGEMFLFVRLIEDKVKEGDSPRENMAEDMVSDISAEVLHTIGAFGMQEIVSDHGLDWNKDILEDISGER